MADEVTLAINGQTYAGWTEVRVTRAIQHCAADFDLTVTERWTGQDQPWQISPFDSVVVAIDGDPVITGYVDTYEPSYEAENHTVRVAGRSKTSDLIDCMPDIKGSQFNGYTLDKIARALAAPFGVDVVINGSIGPGLPQASYEKTETAYAFLEKLCRLRSLLACDNEKGNLVLTSAGTASAAGSLIEGDNIKAARAKLAGNERFQIYAVLAQAPLAWDSVAPQTQVIGTATDSGVPRFRRHAEMAEDPSDRALSAKRAKWRALHNFGISTEATITVQGWRQSNGDLWQINQLVPVTSPFLKLDRTLLIGKVSFLLDNEGGRRTELTVSPQEAFAPDPVAKFKHSKGTSSNWNGAVSIK